MASGKVARRADTDEIRALLDSDEISRLIDETDGLRVTGRRGYGARPLVGACLIKALYGLPTWTRVASLIADHHGLQDALGGCPSLWACYRFTTKLREHSDLLADCLDSIASSLRAEFPGIGHDTAIDSSNLEAFANGRHHLYPDGPMREHFSDPDASWGHRTGISTRGSGKFYGYKLHAVVCTQTGLPLAWQVETAKTHDSKLVASLLDKLAARGYRADTCAMDLGYDFERVHDECETRGVHPVIPLRRPSGKQFVLPVIEKPCRINPRIQRHTEMFHDLYRRRQAIEREFGRLKHDYALAPLRVRGRERVQLHADLVILARLSQAVFRQRTLALAVAA